MIYIKHRGEFYGFRYKRNDFCQRSKPADKTGKAVILKENMPKYLLMDIETDPHLLLSDDELIGISATRIFKNHRFAFEELAK